MTGDFITCRSQAEEYADMTVLLDKTWNAYMGYGTVHGVHFRRAYRECVIRYVISPYCDLIDFGTGAAMDEAMSAAEIDSMQRHGPRLP